VLPALGPLTLDRVYFRCEACAMGEYALDEVLGLDGLRSKQARRLVCFFGGQGSFAKASAASQEACGWTVSDATIRQVCYQEAGRIAAWGDRDEPTYPKFAEAAGDTELQIDAAKVNPFGGWRDLKIAVYAKRPRGAPATPAEWDQRQLPEHAARGAFARIEAAAQFGRRLGEWAERLQVDTEAVAVLGDGAEWIWNQTAFQVPGPKQCLGSYHGSEYRADAGKAVFGPESAGAQQWLEAARQRLLADGWWGRCEQVGQTPCEQGEPARAAREGLLGYFSKQTGRLNYWARLYAGQAIGSGLVEGACKNMIGKRLKQTAARWKLEDVQPMAVLCCCTYSDSWTPYWTAA
jgi:hypothetical protein